MPKHAPVAGDAHPPEDMVVQTALADAVEAYAARVNAGGELSAFPEGRQVTATDVAVTVAAMLSSAEIHSFEIAAMFNI
jgi:hypothetical protein